MTPAAPMDFNKTRAAFMQNISGANIPPLAFKLGYLLMYRYANHKTQLCYPSQTTLAADLGVSIRTIQRLLDILERHGLVIAPGDGRGKSSRYWIDPERVTRASPFTGRKGDKKGRHPTTKKGVTGVARTKKRTKILDGECYALPHPDGERDRASRDEDSLGGGDPPLARDPAGFSSNATPPASRESKDGTRAKNDTEGEHRPHAPPLAEPQIEPAAEIIATGLSQLPDSGVPLDQHRAFAELRAVWDRGWASDDTAKAQAIARAAFERACELAEPGEILAGARVHVAAADAPRFLPQLGNWLNDKGWEKPPPKRGRARTNGQRVHRSTGAKPDMLSEFYEIARLKEAERAAGEVV